MTDQTASRQLLKTYFAENCIPKESNFYDLIDGMLNQADDGILKPSGNPLCIVATGDATTTQKALNFYTGSPSDAGVNPAWMLQLNPRSNQNSPSTAKPGFSISDGTGNSCLFIDNVTKNIGIGTITPSTTLDINGGVNVTGSATFDNTVTLGSAANASNALTVYPPATFNNTLTVTGAATFYGLTENTGATFNNTVTLGSATNASNALTVYAPTTFNNTLTIGQGVSNTNALTVNAPAFFNESITSSMWNVSQTSIPGGIAEDGGLVGNILYYNFTTNGGNLLIFVSGSGWAYAQTGINWCTIGATVQLTPPGRAPIFLPDITVTINGPDQEYHYCFIPIFNYQTNMPKGSYTITVTAYAQNQVNVKNTQEKAPTVIDAHDLINITVIELPFFTPTS